LSLGLSLGLTACGPGSDSGGGPPAPQVAGPAADRSTAAYDDAVSRPREDSVYPSVGDPGVDALHYDLNLTWDAQHEVLTSTETLLYRAATTADHVQLDLARQLEVGHVWMDGKTVTFEHQGKNLVVDSPVTQGDHHVLQVTYSGTPEPVTAPSDRPDVTTTGWTTTPDGSVWTTQEPYGAYSWYAVNDQSSDKATYDLTIHAPESMVGIANGVLRSRRTTGGHTVTQWRLSSPAASYLVTIAIGHYTETQDTGPHGLPISYWTPTGRSDILRKVRYAPRAVAYLEGLVGRYPFGTLGILVVPGMSGMETQTMITLGDNHYTLSKDVLVHEIGHQWYGDAVTPNDWSDLWMSEGMATYLAEANWTGSHGPLDRTQILRRWSTAVDAMRAQYGPPAHYRTQTFGEGNVYYIPALMWDTIRQRIGDATFWRLAAAWPHTHLYTSQDRDTLAAWWSKKSGQDLRPLFHRWLLGHREPPWHAG
ncbi:MAG: M1 family metallopeptidase, partial [Nocardioides sp.]|nr:M1 family metallopeptidase [Nocardioides sp.]